MNKKQTGKKLLCTGKKKYEHKDVEKAFKREEFYRCNWCGSFHKHRFNHAYDLGFEVYSNDSQGSDVNTRMLFLGLLRRVVGLFENSDEITEACDIFDTYEIDNWKKDQKEV